MTTVSGLLRENDAHSPDSAQTDLSAALELLRPYAQRDISRLDASSIRFRPIYLNATADQPVANQISQLPTFIPASKQSSVKPEIKTEYTTNVTPAARQESCSRRPLLIIIWVRSPTNGI